MDGETTIGVLLTIDELKQLKQILDDVYIDPMNETTMYNKLFSILYEHNEK